MQQSVGILLAIVAGAMAAMASVSAKLAMTAEAVHDICVQTVPHIITSTSTSQNMCDSVSFLLRVFCFGLIFLFNALMWTFYTKSLQYTTSTLEATITNTGANFFVTAIAGLVLFGERLSIMWWIGSCLILAGLLLIHSGNKDKDTRPKENVT